MGAGPYEPGLYERATKKDQTDPCKRRMETIKRKWGLPREKQTPVPWKPSD